MTVVPHVDRVGADDGLIVSPHDWLIVGEAWTRWTHGLIVYWREDGETYAVHEGRRHVLRHDEWVRLPKLSDSTMKPRSAA